MPVFQPEPILWVQQLFGPGSEGLMRTFSLLGSTWGVVLAAGLALWVWGRQALYGVLIVIVAEGVLKKGVAAALPVERPTGFGIIRYEVVAGVPSFPSGHVGSATAVWAAMGFLGRVPLGLAVLVGTAVATSRLYLGVHWLADVIAGLILGLLVAWALLRLLDDPSSTLDGLSGRVWAGVAGLAVLAGAIQAAFFLGEDPFAWSGTGAVVGAGVALPLERRWVSDHSGTVLRSRVFRRVVVGSCGLIGLCVASELWSPRVELHGLWTFLGALWCFLGAPLVFDRRPRRFGLPEGGSPPRPRADLPQPGPGSDRVAGRPSTSTSQEEEG